MKAFRKALLAPSPLISWVMLSLLFAVSGPFGSYLHLEPLPRLGFWLTVVGGSLALGVALRVAIEHLRPGLGHARASAVATFLAAGLLALLLPLAGGFVGLPMAAPHVPLEVLVAAILIGLGLALLRHLLAGGAPAEPVSPPRHPEAARPRLLDRMPGGLGGELLHLCAGDHYVEVTTDEGSARVLIRFADAIAEAEPVDGFRVHRSHWVARAAVDRIERESGRSFVVLATGKKVPVSRAHVAKIAPLRQG